MPNVISRLVDISDILSDSRSAYKETKKVAGAVSLRSAQAPGNRNV